MIFVDVSHWNTSLSWPVAVSSGIWGAVVKFSQGTSYLDPAALSHSRDIGAAKVPLVGAYHFGTGENGTTQAEWFLSCVRKAYSDLSNVMLMLDVERNPSQMSVRDAVLFCQGIHDSLGRWPWLYMGRNGPDGAGTGLPNAVLSKCQLLVPAYGDHSGNLGAILPPGFALPSSPAPSLGVLRGWQFTDGRINGGPYSGLGVVDQSKFIGVTSLDEARAIWVS